MTVNAVDPCGGFGASVSYTGAALWAFDVPFLGTVDLTWNGATRGRSWFDTAGIVGEAMNGGVEVWAGRLHVMACRDTGIRPDRRTVALAAFVVAEVARWCW